GGRFVVVPTADASFGKSRIVGETQCTFRDGEALGGPASHAAHNSSNAADDGGVRHLRRVDASSDDGTEDVPTAEEFASTPIDIPLDDGEHSLRDGFHLTMALGLEYPIMRMNVGNGLQPGRLTALGGGFDVFIGGNQKPGMAVGLTIGAASAPSPSFDVDVGDSRASRDLPQQSGWESDGTTLVLHGTQLNVFRIGAFVDYYFSEDSNWHGLLTLGYASASFSGSAIADTPQGFAMQGGLGYDFWLSHHWSLGILAR